MGIISKRYTNLESKFQTKFEFKSRKKKKKTEKEKRKEEEASQQPGLLGFAAQPAQATELAQLALRPRALPAAGPARPHGLAGLLALAAHAASPHAALTSPAATITRAPHVSHPVHSVVFSTPTPQPPV